MIQWTRLIMTAEMQILPLLMLVRIMYIMLNEI